MREKYDRVPLDQEFLRARLERLGTWPPRWPPPFLGEPVEAMLEDLEDGQAFVMRTFPGSFTIDHMDAMTRPQMIRWIHAASRIIKRELGKQADDQYENKPAEYWEQRNEVSSSDE